MHTLDLDDRYLKFLHVIRESAAKVNNNKYVPVKAKTVAAKAVRKSKSKVYLRVNGLGKSFRTRLNCVLRVLIRTFLFGFAVNTTDVE